MEVVGARTGVYSLSGSAGNDTSRSAHNHQLGTMHSRQHQQPGKNYSAFVSPGIGSAANDRKIDGKADGVLRTTEVRVHGLDGMVDGEIRPGEFHVVDGEGRTGEGFTNRAHGCPPSPSSSEVEFAAKGAYPS